MQDTSLKTPQNALKQAEKLSSRNPKSRTCPAFWFFQVSNAGLSCQKQDGWQVCLYTVKGFNLAGTKFSKLAAILLGFNFTNLKHLPLVSMVNIILARDLIQRICCLAKLAKLNPQRKLVTLQYMYCIWNKVNK